MVSCHSNIWIYRSSHCALWPIRVLVVVHCHFCFTCFNYLLLKTLLDNVLFHLQVAKPFLETKTANKVKFVYSDDVNSKRIIEDLFDMDQLESAFGGNNNVVFNITKYAEMMKEDNKQMRCFWSGVSPSALASEKAQTSSGLVDSKTSNSSESSENERTDGDVH